MTLKVIHRLQAFSNWNTIRQTFVQHFTRFQLTACSYGSSALAELLVFRRYWPLKSTFSCKVEKRWKWVVFGAPIIKGRDTPNFGNAFSNLAHFRRCIRFWLRSVDWARRVADEKVEDRTTDDYSSGGLMMREVAGCKRLSCGLSDRRTTWVGYCRLRDATSKPVDSSRHWQQDDCRPASLPWTLISHSSTYVSFTATWHRRLSNATLVTD